jgi:hypothetical protein
MDSDGMDIWFNKVYEKRPGGKDGKKSLLIFDSFRGHLKDEIKNKAKTMNIELVVIPGVLTGQLQPLDVCLNKTFKVALREEWSKWIIHTKLLTKSGNIKKPSLYQVCEWVKHAWDSVKTESVIYSFKKCGISNDMDGNEDGILYESESLESYSCLNDDKTDFSGEKTNSNSTILFSDDVIQDENYKY